MNAAEQRALLELFATIDAVMTEHDCFAPDKVTIGHGRTYRAWKRARRVLALQSHVPLAQRIPEAKPRG